VTATAVEPVWFKIKDRVVRAGGVAVQAAMSNLDVAGRWHETYRDGDVDGFLACLGPGWVIHEGGGATSTAGDLAEITRLHAASFPQGPPVRPRD
jgi:hypothetical protein